MLPRRHGLLAVLLALACLHCPPDNKDLLYEPVPLAPHEVKIAADAEGDAKAPAHVAVYLQRGILQMKGGAGHTLEGVATGAAGDPPPRLSLTQDRIALVQSNVGGATPRGDANFQLALGATPMSLEIDTGAGEAQTIDLGGVPVKEGRFHTASGHLTIDWSGANPLPGGLLVLKTEAGYIDLSHLGRSGATHISVSDTAGFVSLDFDDLPAAAASSPGVTVSASVTSGKLVLEVPHGVAARATVQAPASHVALKGWTPDAEPFTFLAGDPAAPARVTARVLVQGGSVELRAE
jgi:hypothetical protein